jgi:hypothetical protein
MKFLRGIVFFGAIALLLLHEYEASCAGLLIAIYMKMEADNDK